MKAEQINRLLYDYCRWNGSQRLLTILEDPTNETVDITDEKNRNLFDLAIIHDFIEVLNILLDYFKKTNFQRDPEEARASKLILHEEILDGVLEATGGITPRIKEAVKKYLEEDKNIELNGLPNTISPSQKEPLQKKLSEETDRQVQVEVIRATQLKITPAEPDKLKLLHAALKWFEGDYITHENAIYLTEENVHELLTFLEIEETSNHLSNITLHNEDDSKENTNIKIKKNEDDGKENSAQNSTSFKNSNLQTAETTYTGFESKTLQASQVLPSELNVIGICEGENHES